MMSSYQMPQKILLTCVFGMVIGDVAGNSCFENFTSSSTIVNYIRPQRNSSLTSVSAPSGLYCDAGLSLEAIVNPITVIAPGQGYPRCLTLDEVIRTGPFNRTGPVSSGCRWRIQNDGSAKMILVSISHVSPNLGTSCKSQLNISYFPDSSESQRIYTTYLCGQWNDTAVLTSREPVKVQFDNDRQNRSFNFLYFSYDVIEQRPPKVLNATHLLQALQAFSVESGILHDLNITLPSNVPSNEYGVTATVLFSNIEIYVDPGKTECTPSTNHNAECDSKLQLDENGTATVRSAGRSIHLRFRSEIKNSNYHEVYGVFLKYSSYLLTDSIAINRPCLNGGNISAVGCSCPVGWVGNHCEIDVDECSVVKQTCLNGGTCHNTNGSYTCTCKGGFTGLQCEDDSTTNNRSCLNGGNMTDVGCRCPVGWVGDYCQSDVDECSVVKQICLNHGNCNNTNGSYKCTCMKGFTGHNCELVNSTTTKCLNGGRRSVGGCTCPVGWVGDYCQIDVDECSVVKQTCLNGGTCHNTNGSYTCTCKGGFTGHQCEDDLNPIECLNDGSVAEDGCKCRDGWVGDHCQIDVDECQVVKQVCFNGGTFYNEKGSYRCACTSGFTGQQCEQATDSSTTDKYCLNGGNNTNVGCRCPVGWIGDHCQIDIDECSVVKQTCLNSGTCHNTNGSYNCTCMRGFTGQQCELAPSDPDAGKQTDTEYGEQAPYSQKDLIVAIIVSFMSGVLIVLVIVLVIFLNRKRCFFQKKDSKVAEKQHRAYDDSVVNTNADARDIGEACGIRNSSDTLTYQHLSGPTSGSMTGEHVYSGLRMSEITSSTSADNRKEQDGAYVYIDNRNNPHTKDDSGVTSVFAKSNVPAGETPQQDGPAYLTLEPVPYGTKANASIRRDAANGVADQTNDSTDGPTYFVLEKDGTDYVQDQNNSDGGPTYFVLEEKDKSDPTKDQDNPTSDGGPTYFVLEKENHDPVQNDHTSNPTYFVLEKDG